MKSTNWKKYAIEFLSVFVAVISAFALSNWNDNRNSEHSELKILTEIKNGIGFDLKDFNSNVGGHKLSLRAIDVFRDLIIGDTVNQDSIGLYYTTLFRDYTPVINRSGYESLKEAGLKTISNDSLRFEIISLYDYYYGIIEILDKVFEMQSFENYFAAVNELLHPYMEFNEAGELILITNPEALTESEKKEILSYLWRLENNRKMKLSRYKLILSEMEKVKERVEDEIREKD
ncbi:hypothetical protein [Reichenbachiella ulvae]|uniref:Uncharacterized protein n=1 Tax=Reichenbachiella ulvae TaxID=2980104 RepID=A0ABT3CZD4_9BACT|nr:hypothetical protein [Reichenbachiella ulvae]MCV9389058.1 hypothetical protein [Reichenbachiella ulvae]